MKTSSHVSVAIVFVAAVILAGCYTQLMTPQEFTAARRERPVIRVDATSNLNYSSNCLSCHTQSELDDRYFDMQMYGITTAHGFVIEPSLWASAPSPMYDPPYFPPGPGFPIQPWWLPPPVIVVSPTPTSNSPVNKGNRPRTDGPTRDTNVDRPRTEPIPTYTPPSNSGSGTTTSSTPPPATSIAPPQTQQPSNTTTETRSRDDSSSSNSGSSRSRSDGSTRDDTSRPR